MGGKGGGALCEPGCPYHRLGHVHDCLRTALPKPPARSANAHYNTRVAVERMCEIECLERKELH